MKRAYVEIRSQKARGSWPRQGPDTYVAVQIVPEGQVRLKHLQQLAAERRGIEIVYCGQGYRGHHGPRSALGRALAEAERIADKVNTEAL